MERLGYSLDWVTGNSRNVKPVTVNRVQWDHDEIHSVLEVFGADWFASGRMVKALQEALARFVGGGTFILTNSGTAALETAVQALLHTGAVRRGDIVLHPACTFNTSAACFAKYGLNPLFVDIDPHTYNIDPALAQEAIQHYQPKLAVIPHLLGNTTNVAELFQQIPNVIGDSCDTLGTKYAGVEVGAYSRFTAYSFYASHHITTAGVGGAIRVNIPEDYKLAESLVYWGRDPDAVKGYDVESFMNRYSYNTLGSDAQMTEMQAAFGLAQLAKLPEWNKRRAAAWHAIDQLVGRYGEHFLLPAWNTKTEPSWFGYPLTVREEAPFKREALVQKLLDAQIEIRPLFSGNTMRQKAWKSVNYISYGRTPNADRCLTNSFFLPAWGMSDESLAYLLESFQAAMRSVLKLTAYA